MERTPYESELVPADDAVTVFRGSGGECAEFSLVLDSRSVPHERVYAGGGDWLLRVRPPVAEAALEELNRYRGERPAPRRDPPAWVPFTGSAFGVVAYAVVLILVAYCAGVSFLGRDWFEVGALRSEHGAAREWWRAFTALSLHLDQEHLMGNLLFGTGVGALAGRMFGPGVAWLGILLAGAVADYADMVVSPLGHRAVGASTAVFAALGMLAGFGWRQRLGVSERRMYRWAPLFAASCLLALLGAGNEHVDVLGHLLGFFAGVATGALLVQSVAVRARSRGAQAVAGACALALLVAAWGVALR